MHNILLKSARTQQLPSPFSYPLPNHINTIRKPFNSGSIRFAQAGSEPKQTDEMDSKNQTTQPESKTVDTMSSFGEGYATRSDEEGFGGIYRRNQYLFKERIERESRAEEFDHSQGSEVKEKEKARHQHKVA